MSDPTSMTLPERFDYLENVLAHEIQERTREVHTAVLAILSQKHHFQLGPPGTAKSLLVGRIAKRISDLGDEGYFHWLLTQYTTPEEIFGPPDIGLFKQGVYQRVTRRKLPRAYFVFLDEIFKGNSSILNANLTAMNERLFFNGEMEPHIPLMTMFAASNELPDGDELNALWDRLHFRHIIKPMQESSNFMRMIQSDMPKDPEPVLSLAEVKEAVALVEHVQLPGEIFDTVKELRDNLRSEGVEPTDRRWVECLDIIRAEAFFNGHEVAEIGDMRPLMHVLWSHEKDIKTVTREVLDLANPIDREANDLLDRVNDLHSDLTRILKDADNPKQAAKQVVEIHGKMQRAAARKADLMARAQDAGTESEILDALNAKFKETAKLMYKGFGVDKD